MNEINNVEDTCSCSFCGKIQFEVERLVTGPGVHICNECIDLCSEVVHEKNTKAINNGVSELTPRIIFEALNKHIIGQSDAKKVFSVAAYNHYKRNNSSHPETMAKSNVLMIGPSGTGKTLLCQTLADVLDVPFVIGDASALTENGYAGDDVESLLTSLIINANNDIDAAQKGIVFIDEIDKLSTFSNERGVDVSRKGVQQSLLKIIEGCVIPVSPTFSNNSNKPKSKILLDTSNVLFICGGSFPGLEDFVSNRTDKGGIGITAQLKDRNKSLNDLLGNITTTDLEGYGMIKEFIGRLPVVTTLKELTLDEMVSILTEPDNSIVSQFQKLFLEDDIDLLFEDAALRAIAKKAIDNKTGARGLRTIMEDLLLVTMFNAPEMTSTETIVVTKNMVEKGDEPLYVGMEESAKALL